MLQDIQEKETCEDECSVSESSNELDPHFVGVGVRKLLTTQSCEKDSGGEEVSSDGASPLMSNGSGFNVSKVSPEQEEIVVGVGEDSDKNCKEVRCIDTVKNNENNCELLVNNENDGRNELLSVHRNQSTGDEELLPVDSRLARGIENGSMYGELEQNIQRVQRTIDSLVIPYIDEHSHWDSPATLSGSGSRNLKLIRSRSCRANFLAASSSPDLEKGEDGEATPPDGLEKTFPGRPEGGRKHWNIPPCSFGANAARLSRNDSLSSNGSAFVDQLKSQNQLGDEDIPSVHTFVAGLKEMTKHQFGDKIDDQVREILFILCFSFGCEGSTLSRQVTTLLLAQYGFCPYASVTFYGWDLLKQIGLIC